MNEAISENNKKKIPQVCFCKLRRLNRFLP